MDQDLECLRDHSRMENNHPASVIKADWVNCETGHHENNVILGIPKVGSRIRCRKKLLDGGTIVSHCLSVQGMNEDSFLLTDVVICLLGTMAIFEKVIKKKQAIFNFDSQVSEEMILS